MRFLDFAKVAALWHRLHQFAGTPAHRGDGTVEFAGKTATAMWFWSGAAMATKPSTPT
jgi:hypothetical protein